jgi:hypothetical protein
MELHYTQIHKEFNERLTPAFTKRGIINKLYPETWTADIQIVGSTQGIIKGVPLSSAIDINDVRIGDKCRVDMFDENNPNDMVVAYTYGRAKSKVVSTPASNADIFVDRIHPFSSNTVHFVSDTLVIFDNNAQLRTAIIHGNPEVSDTINIEDPNGGTVFRFKSGSEAILYRSIWPIDDNMFELGRNYFDTTGARRWSRVNTVDLSVASISPTLSEFSINVNGHLVPTGDAWDLGTSTQRWENAYFVNAFVTNQTANKFVTGDLAFRRKDKIVFTLKETEKRLMLYNKSKKMIAYFDEGGDFFIKGRVRHIE